MAYLQPPLTIISSNTDHTHGSRHHHHHHASKSSVDDESFRLPAATWFDEDLNHFVALEERIDPNASSRESFHSGSLVSGLESLITKGEEDEEEEESSEEFELVRYQAFGMPRGNNNSKRAKNNNIFSNQDRYPFHDYDLVGTGSDVDDDMNDLDASHRANNLSAFESAAKKAAQERENKSLITEIAVSFHLPASLANMEVREEQSTSGHTENTTDDDTATILLTRRIPILAKFSPVVNGVRYFALQYTPT